MQKRPTETLGVDDVSQTQACDAQEAIVIAGMCGSCAGVHGSKRVVNLPFGAVKRSHSAPAREQRSLRKQRRRASPAQSEEGKSRAPARARTAAAQHWVLRNMLWLWRSRLDNTPAPANFRSQVATALVTLRHP